MRVTPGQIVRARVVETSAEGLRLRAGRLDVWVDVTDVEWYRAVDPREYASVGEELEVTILRAPAADRPAGGWLPRPARARRRPPAADPQ